MRLVILFSMSLLACRSEGNLKVNGIDTTDTAIATGQDTADSRLDTAPIDADGDGHPEATDCDDTNPEVHPDAMESCNGLDDDCDEEVDESDATDAPTWYSDVDEDGFGDDVHSTVSCEQPEGHSALGGDCNDQDSRYHPDAAEPDCTDANDYNCDGSVGWADDDGDGWAACQECDDTERRVNPSATEICDGIDNNCDGSTDGTDAVDTTTFYADADSDGHGDATQSTQACTAPSAHVVDNTDCNDNNASVHPSASEFCNGIDDDCDGLTDENDAADASTFYLDVDSDGYGTSALTATACSAPSGYVTTDDDCDDADASINPAATEVCNGVDDDCDGDTDSTATDRVSFYEDADCDGEGGTNTQLSCTSPGSGWVNSTGDCDDADPLTFSSAIEICDTTDNNCDGSVDESCTDTHQAPTPSHPPLASSGYPAACALVGELEGTHNSHTTADLPVAMAILDGSSSGLVESINLDTDLLDWSIRYGSNYTGSPGNFSPTTPWPAFSSQGSKGAARMRGYIHIGCGDSLHYTMGLLGNDALSFSIEGQVLIDIQWTGGLWKSYRYITFPEPGLYAFELQWSTNLVATIDPLELIWAVGFLPGYEDYDTSCSYQACTYGTGVPIPGFSVVDGAHLLQSPNGSATSCEQCTADTDCSNQPATCNSAGICE